MGKHKVGTEFLYQGDVYRVRELSRFGDIIAMSLKDPENVITLTPEKFTWFTTPDNTN